MLGWGEIGKSNPLFCEEADTKYARIPTDSNVKLDFFTDVMSTSSEIWLAVPRSLLEIGTVFFSLSLFSLQTAHGKHIVCKQPCIMGDNTVSHCFSAI